jgi:hypothetical protein
MADTGITVDPNLVQRLVEQAVEANIAKLVDQLCQDPAWVEKIEKQIERQITQSTVDSVVRQLSKIDLNPVIKERIDENMVKFQQDILKNFTSTGIVDQATRCQLTIMDDTTVVENQLTTRDLHIVNVATIEDLVVKGSINIDNRSWDTLANGISEKTLNKLTQEWKTMLISQVADQIKTNGIDFDTVHIDGELLVSGNALSTAIKETHIQTVGTLHTLDVAGESTFNNQTFNVLNKRVGVNTISPEMALSIWDEEVSVVVGKNKANEAYIGTNRAQGVSIGVNRIPQIEINADGLTRIKQLQVGLHRISHATQVPGWSGNKGDIVFNANLGDDRVFAWVCIGAHRWKTLKSAE